MLKKVFSSFAFIAYAFVPLATMSAYALEQIDTYVPAAKKVGEARMTYIFWNIYDITLYAPQGIWQQDKPFALKLSYLRSLDGKKIADRSAEEMRKQGFTDKVKLAAWHAKMREIFPDVDKGIALTGINTEAGEVVFYKNNAEIGRIKDPQFSHVFFGIWLNEKTSAPDLRRKLLGVL